jgi:hypothetical protein
VGPWGRGAVGPWGGGLGRWKPNATVDKGVAGAHRLPGERAATANVRLGPAIGWYCRGASPSTVHRFRPFLPARNHPLVGLGGGRCPSHALPMPI